MRVVLEIDNNYEDDVQIHTRVEADIEPPPADETSTAYADWEYEEIFPHVGADRFAGNGGLTRTPNAGYYVTIAEADDPALVGKYIEFL